MTEIASCFEMAKAMEEAQRAKDEQAQLVSELRVELSEATSALRTDLAVTKTELTQAETSADAQSEAVTALRAELQTSRTQRADLLSAHRGRADSAQHAMAAVAETEASEPPAQLHAEGAEEAWRQAPQPASPGPAPAGPRVR